MTENLSNRKFDIFHFKDELDFIINRIITLRYTQKAYIAN